FQTSVNVVDPQAARTNAAATTIVPVERCIGGLRVAGSLWPVSGPPRWPRGLRDPRSADIQHAKRPDRTRRGGGHGPTRAPGHLGTGATDHAGSDPWNTAAPMRSRLRSQSEQARETLPALLADRVECTPVLVAGTRGYAFTGDRLWKDKNGLIIRACPIPEPTRSRGSAPSRPPAAGATSQRAGSSSPSTRSPSEPTRRPSTASTTSSASSGARSGLAFVTFASRRRRPSPDRA